MTLVVFRPSAAMRVAGRSVEIGGGGLRAAFADELRPGERVEIEFALPPSRHTMRFPVVVRHHDGSAFGFEFLTLKRSHRKALDALEQHAGAGLLPVINMTEQEAAAAAAVRNDTVTCPTCGSEYGKDEVMCFNCGTHAEIPPEPERPPKEEKPLKLFRSNAWVPTWMPARYRTAGALAMGGDSLIALLFVLTLGLGLWQWLNTPTKDEAGHNVHISFSDVLLSADPLPATTAVRDQMVFTSPAPARSRRSSGSLLPSASFSVSSSGPVGTPGSASAETRRPAAVEKAEAYLGSAASRISAEQPSTPKWARTAETAAVRAGASLPTPQIPAAAGASIGSAASTSANAVASLPAGAAQALNEREEHWRGAGLQLVERVVPRYPTLAESERLQGEVVLVATIAKDGRVADVRPVSGPAVLASSAVDAVRQWRFRPYQVDGKPVQVQTNIRVNFNLDK